jgi:SH3-like domain-containing protein
MQRKPRIFISYRRADSRKDAARIHDRLTIAFGNQNIFKDVDDIPPGHDFRAVLANGVDQCDVLLVIIGQHWLNLQDKHGYRRLDDPNDFVRFEIERAINSNRILVIPVLVDTASMPSGEELPASLQELAFKNAVTVRDDPDFHRDIDRLIKQLQRPELLPSLAFEKADTPPTRKSNWRIAGGFGAGIAVLLTAILLIANSLDGNQSGPMPTTEVAVVVSATDTPTETPRPTDTLISTDTSSATSQPSKTPQSTSTLTPPQESSATFILTTTATLMPTQVASSTIAPNPTNTVTSLSTTTSNANLSIQPEDAVVSIKSTSANLRSGPGTNYSIVGSADNGEYFEVIARSGTGNNIWYLVDRTDEASVWIADAVVNLSPENISVPVALTIPAEPAIQIQSPSTSCTGRFSIGMSIITHGGMSNFSNHLPLWRTAQIGMIDTEPIGILTQDIVANDSNFAGWVGGYTYVTVLKCNEKTYQVRTPDGIVGWMGEGDFVPQ